MLRSNRIMRNMCSDMFRTITSNFRAWFFQIKFGKKLLFRRLGLFLLKSNQPRFAALSAGMERGRHNFIWRSSEPEAKRAPVLDHSRQLTHPLCPTPNALIPRRFKKSFGLIKKSNTSYFRQNINVLIKYYFINSRLTPLLQTVTFLWPSAFFLSHFFSSKLYIDSSNFNIFSQ